MARMTTSRVASRTLFSPLVTRETVIGDTPALRATSWIVTALPLRRRLFLLTVAFMRSLTTSVASPTVPLTVDRYKPTRWISYFTRLARNQAPPARPGQSPGTSSPARSSPGARAGRGEGLDSENTGFAHHDWPRHAT